MLNSTMILFLILLPRIVKAIPLRVRIQKGDDEKWLSDQVDLSLATQSGNKLITTGMVINIFKALLSC